MNPSLSAALIGALLVAAGSSQAATQVRIDCGDTDVILTEEQAMTIRDVNSITDTSSAEYAAAVCDLFAGIDASGYENPTPVKVKMPNGSELEAEIQASQQ